MKQLYYINNKINEETISIYQNLIIGNIILTMKMLVSDYETECKGIIKTNLTSNINSIKELNEITDSHLVYNGANYLKTSLFNSIKNLLKDEDVNKVWKNITKLKVEDGVIQFMENIDRFDPNNQFIPTKRVI
jgi:hypothetical protein